MSPEIYNEKKLVALLYKIIGMSHSPGCSCKGVYVDKIVDEVNDSNCIIFRAELKEMVLKNIKELYPYE